VSAHRVAVLVPPQVNVFDLGVALEVFALPRPELGLEWYDVEVCTTRPGTDLGVVGALGLTAPHGLEAVARADTVVVVGADKTEPPVGREILEAIRAAHGRGARLVSLCTGAFILAAAGVLDGRRATTHWKRARLLAERFPRVDVDPNVLYVDDGQVLTSAGTAAAVDLCLHIVRKDLGARAARHVARAMVVPPHREGGQAQFVMTPVPEFRGSLDGVQRAMEYAAHHLDEQLTLERMSALAFMSPRSFSRRFREVTGTTPMRWLLEQRLTRARELLEETDESVERVAAVAGFGSAITLRQRFAQVLGTSPSSYRKTFRSHAQQRTA
jgi:AraC family transcriptional activator FtrA